MEEESQINRIESYLSGQMTNEEKTPFEKELSSDSELNRLFREHKFFLDGIAGMKAEAFIEKMHRQKDVGRISRKAGFRSMLSYISIAASVILLIGITYFISQSSGLPHLAKKYYAAPFAQILRSDAPPEDSVFQQGMTAFGNKNWNSAIESFSKVGTTHSLYPRSLYYMAHAYIGEKQYEKALEVFNSPELTEGQYAQQTEWNKVLIKMYLDHPKEEIISDLNRIENNPHHFYRDKAKELLQRINPK